MSNDYNPHYPEGPKAPEPVSSIPVQEPHDYFSLIQACRLLFKTARHPRIDPMWHNLELQLVEYRFYLEKIEGEEFNDWKNHRLTVIKHYLGF